MELPLAPPREACRNMKCSSYSCWNPLASVHHSNARALTSPREGEAVLQERPPPANPFSSRLDAPTPLKHRLRQIETDERRRHRTIPLMKNVLSVMWRCRAGNGGRPSHQSRTSSLPQWGQRTATNAMINPHFRSRYLILPIWRKPP